MTFKLTDSINPRYNITGKTDMSDRIRGRGNNSWNDFRAKKKSYRINFKDKTPLFGLEAAKNWVLLGQHRDETLLFNAVAFELGNRFAFPFNHSFNFIDLYINGEYRGNYLLTEQNQVGPGRVNIEKGGWFAEIDEYYDDEPKFRTASYNLPVMIKWPKGGKTACGEENPAHIPVKNDFNGLADALASPDFPENGYRELIDITTFIDFLMINELAANTDLSHPRSTFLYKDKDGAISMGPLWDFDSGYGWNYRNWMESGFNDHFNYPDRRPPLHLFLSRFYEDPVFLVKYKERWNEKYDTIASIPVFIDETAKKLEKSANMNFENWWYKTYAPFTDTRPAQPNIFGDAILRLKNWYSARVYYLNAEFNKVDVLPKNKTFSYRTKENYEISPQTFTLVSYGQISDPSASLQKGGSSSFEITGEWNQNATGNGGYLAVISVTPKKALPEEMLTGTDTLILSGKNQNAAFTLKVPLNFAQLKESVTPLSNKDTEPQKRGIGSHLMFWRR
ncbi:MAG: CotH kinase family protein [Chitinispirillales bacterium]|nr:CotH kinase family protein [Chitinispirillales bacterium]